MADFSLTPPPQRNWFDPIAKGYEAVSTIQDQAARRNWFNQQLQQKQEERGAIKQFGQTGDTKALMGVDPKLAMTIQDHIAKTPPPELMKINMALEAGKGMRGMVTPDNYGDYKALLERNGLPANYLPPPDQVKKDPNLLQKVLYAGDIFQAKLKQMGTPGTTVIGPEGSYQVPGRAVIDPRLRQKTSEQISDEAAARELGKRSVTPARTGTDKPPLKMTDYGIFREDYKKEHRDATAPEIRQAWVRASQGGKGKTPKGEGREHTPSRKLEDGKSPEEQTGAFYQTFKNALSGPNKAAAIKRSQELNDGYYEKAQKEGLL